MDGRHPPSASGKLMPESSTSTRKRGAYPNCDTTAVLSSITRMITLIMLLLLIPATAPAQTVTITDDTPVMSVAPYLFILEDPGQQLTLEQATSADTLNKFTPYMDNLRNLGLKDSAWWLRIDIQRTDTTETDWYAQFAAPLLTSESAAYFLAAANSAPVPLKNLQEKPDEFRLYTLKLPKLKKFTLIMRLNNQGDALMHFPLQVLNTEQLYKKIASDYFLYGGIMISLLVMAIYNLFLFFSLRYYAYLTLVVYLLASILLVQKTTNIIPELSFLQDPTTFYHSFTIQLALIAGLQFWRQLLDVKRLLPTLDKIAWYLLIFMTGITPFISFLPYSNAWPLAMIALVLVTITLFCALVIKKHPSTATSLFLAFITTIVSAVPITICSFGLFVDKIEIALDAYNIGILCATVLLSFTLAEHTRQLRVQAERAKAEGKAKDRFLATMSHELRTPMHSTTSIIHLLKTTPLSDEQSAHISRLETSTNHMLELINSVLDLARIKSNKIHLEKYPFNMDDLLSELEQLLGEKARQQQLSLSVINHADTAERLLVGDVIRLKQILLNLLDNAIKFTDTGGVALTITPCGEAMENAQKLTFTVTDTGIGISNTQKKRIFEAFSQADSDTTRRYGGSGLGLSISDQLVKSMGGKLALESIPNKGSRFSFKLTFPLAPPQEKPTQQAVHSASIPGTTCVLLVEDDPLNRMLGYELLTVMGFTCITANDGEDAINQLPEHPIDLILMDISMPTMDGYQATRNIRATPEFATLPIIALTAHSTVDGKKHYRQAGMNDYLCKPFHPERLKEKVLFWTAAENTGEPIIPAPANPEATTPLLPFPP